MRCDRTKITLAIYFGHGPKIILSPVHVIFFQVNSFVQFPSATNTSIESMHATDLSTEAEVQRNVLYILY